MSLKALWRDYCENTTFHGFAYWTKSVRSTSVPERVFWVVVTFLGFGCAAAVLHSTIKYWIDYPTEMTIDTFSLPTTELAYPAITVCKSSPYETAEYVRAMFDNFQYSCSTTDPESCRKTELLRLHYPRYSGFTYAEPLIGPPLPPPVFGPPPTDKFIDLFYKLYLSGGLVSETSKMYSSKDFAYGDKLGVFAPAYFAAKQPFSNIMQNLIGNATAGIDNSREWFEQLGFINVTLRLPGGDGRKEVHSAYFLGECAVGKKYSGICDLLKRGHESFWQDLTECHRARMTTTNNTAWKLTELTAASANYTGTCLDAVNATKGQRDAFVPLTDYDLFAISEVLLWEGFTADEFAFGYKLSRMEVVEKYCAATRKCSYAALASTFRDTMLKLRFTQLMSLPVEDFGKLLAALPAVGQASCKVCKSDEVFFPEYLTAGATLEGWNVVLKAIHDVVPRNVTLASGGVPKFHPLFTAEDFLPSPFSYNPHQLNYSIDSLAKLLLYGTYVKTKAELNVVDPEVIVTKDLDKFPYPRHAEYRAPYFSPLDLSEVNGGNQVTFSAGLTDSGVCHVFNGNSLNRTYASGGKRIKDLGSALDSRGPVRPKNITGTGRIFELVFWLNVADRSIRNKVLAFPRRKGSASIAVNEWTSYFNVRMNQFEVLGGQQVIVKVKPVSHIATDAFRQLDPDERNCLFPYERADTGNMFQSYNEKACQFECRLKFAARQAGCIPWDYPVPQRSAGGDDDLDWGALEICRSNHSGDNGENRLSVFERAMDSDAALRQSGCDDCSPNCEEVTFETQVNTLELDVEGLCDRNGDWRSIDRVMRDWQRVSSTAAHWAGEISPANYRRWFETMKLDKWTALGVTNFSYGLPTDDAIKMCKKIYKLDVAKIVVQIADPIVVQIKKGVRITFPDQLAVIGGTMGLFTGASLMSIIETIFWLHKPIANMLKRQLLGSEPVKRRSSRVA